MHAMHSTPAPLRGHLRGTACLPGYTLLSLMLPADPKHECSDYFNLSRQMHYSFAENFQVRDV